MKDENGLTPKMALFIHYYCGECQYNGTQSVIKAGYKGSNGTMRWLANKLLTNSNIKTIIAKRLADISEKAEITQERIAQEISDIAFGQITFTVGCQVNMANKLKALELLGRYKAMFTDNVKQTGEGLTINVKGREIPENKAEKSVFKLRTGTDNVPATIDFKATGAGQD